MPSTARAALKATAPFMAVALVRTSPPTATDVVAAKVSPASNTFIVALAMSDRSGLRGSPDQPAALQGSRPSGSELELGQIFGGHDFRRPEDQFAARADRVFAKPACRQLLTFLASDLALRDGLGGVIGKIAEIGDVPPDVLGRAILDVFRDESGRRET